MNASAPTIVRILGLEGFAVFEHGAMGIPFRFYLGESGELDRRAAAEEAFQLVDQLDERLSFGREDSDVTRINRAQVGDVIRIHKTTHRSLLAALAAAQASGGGFDPFVDSAALRAKGQSVPAYLLDRETDGNGAGPTPALSVDPEQPQVTKLSGARWLDLGAVGKGAALDAAAELLRARGITSAALVGGGSSIVVWGTSVIDDSGEWPLRFPHWRDGPPLRVKAPFALSGFGTDSPTGQLTAAQGGHLRPQSLVLAADASGADAFAAAAAAMSDAELGTLSARPDARGLSIYAARTDRSPFASGLFQAVARREPVVSLVLPCSSASEHLPVFLDELCQALATSELRAEVIVVDDGSPGPEAEITSEAVDARRYAHAFLHPLRRVDRPRGKGGAVYVSWREHAAMATRWLAFVDANSAVPAAEVVRGLTLAVDLPHEDILVVANRHHREPDRPVRRGWWRQWSSAWLARWVRRQLDLDVADSRCGFKIVPAAWWRRRDLAGDWREAGQAFDLDLLLAAKADGLTAHNLPISWREVGRAPGRVKTGWNFVQTVRQRRRARRS